MGLMFFWVSVVLLQFLLGGGLFLLMGFCVRCWGFWRLFAVAGVDKVLRGLLLTVGLKM